MRQSAAERRHPTSEVRGRSREDPMPEGRRPRGVTPRRRSGAVAESTDCDGTGMAERSYPTSEVGGAAERSYPASEVRGSGWEDQPHVQVAVAARAQEGLEELSHIEGQEGRQ